MAVMSGSRVGGAIQSAPGGMSWPWIDTSVLPFALRGKLLPPIVKMNNLLKWTFLKFIKWHI